jgi:hypothetical protein
MARGDRGIQARVNRHATAAAVQDQRNQAGAQVVPPLQIVPNGAVLDAGLLAAAGRAPAPNARPAFRATRSIRANAKLMENINTLSDMWEELNTDMAMVTISLHLSLREKKSTGKAQRSRTNTVGD